MGLLRFLGPHSPAYTFWLRLTGGGKRIGADTHGNVYFEAPARTGYTYTRRWVYYRDVPDATLVPPEWHGWLHHQTDIVPTDESASYRQHWIKPHQPNLTGTDRTYRPPGHVLEGGKRDKATGDYEAWTPDET